MQDDLLSTQAKQDSALADFQMLIGSPGWSLLVEMTKANIELVKKRILEGSENETKESIDNLRCKLKAYEEVINTPQDIIKKLTSEEPAEPNHDPYD